MAYLTQGTMKQMRDELFTHMQTLPIKYFDTHAHGDIMSVYTNDIDTLRQMVSQSIPQMLNCLITIISVLASMISLSIPLTILTLVMVAVMLLCSRYFVGNSGRFFIDQQRELGRVNGYIEEMMNGQKVIKVFCTSSRPSKSSTNSTTAFTTAPTGPTPTLWSPCRSTASSAT